MQFTVKVKLVQRGCPSQTLASIENSPISANFEGAIKYELLPEVKVTKLGRTLSPVIKVVRLSELPSGSL